MYGGYTPEMDEYLRGLRHRNLSWTETAEHFNTHFETNKATETLKKRYYTIQNLDSIEDEKYQLDLIKTDYRQRQTNSKIRKQNKLLANYLNSYDDAVDQIEKMIREQVKPEKIKLPKQNRLKQKRNMTIEVLLSDLHVGLSTKTYNAEIARQRISDFAQTVIGEAKRYNLKYNIDRIILACLGDLIHSETMHGLESARAVDMGNSEQIYTVSKLIWWYFLEPILKTGYDVTFVGITGNHDRTELAKTYVDTGKNSVTWIIYNTLKELALAKGYKNITYNIPEGKYTSENIYGKVALFEHGDELKNTNDKTLLGHLEHRSRQINELITYLRVAHYHDYKMLSRGKIIVNGAICGADGYSDGKGYCSEVTQTINTYIQTKNRPTSFYHSFPVYLD